MQFRDDLHLYLSLSQLVSVCTCALLLQVVLLLVSTIHRVSYRRVWKTANDSAEDHKLRHSWSLPSTPLWCWLPLRAGMTRAETWKRLSRRSVLFTSCIALAQATTSTSLLYMRTGAWTTQPYEWYSLQATGVRVFGQTMQPPRSVLDSCLPNVNLGHESNRLLQIQDVLPTQSPSSTLVVYVVPYSRDGLVQVTEAQTKPTREQIVSKMLRQSRQDAASEYARITPVEQLTMFPYLWHSILGSSFSGFVQASNPYTRVVREAGVEYQLIRSQEELDLLQPGANVFAVVQAMEDVLQLTATLPKHSAVGFIALSKENCNNPSASRYASHPQIKFGLFPYGDCSIVDYDRFHVIPLGPSFEHGFPVNTHRTNIPLVHSRSQLLNLMVSWTVEKPTRVQAMIAALNVCDAPVATRRQCVIEHNDLAFKALQKIDSSLGTNLRWVLSAAPNAYVENLKQSVFTLCPFGKNPEQYRIWEALAAGSIPIVEDIPEEDPTFIPGTFLHPSYPDSWKCRPGFEIHRFLKQNQAPVVFVLDWKRDLPKVIRYYTEGNPQRLIELQERVVTWYQEMGEHLQAILVRQSLRFYNHHPKVF